MEIREEFLWGYAEKLEEDAATALAYAMEELENSKNPEIHGRKEVLKEPGMAVNGIPVSVYNINHGI